MYDLQIGAVSLYKERNVSGTYLLGYYPLLYYSSKTHVIPEALNKGELPPLFLVQSFDLSESLKFVGSNMNVDTLLHHFMLGTREIPLDVPENTYCFHMYFDMITRNTEWADYKGYAFHVMEVTLFGKNMLNLDIEIAKFSISIRFTDISRNDLLGKIVHTGRLSVNVDTFLQGVFAFSSPSTGFNVKTSDSSNKNEIYNKDTPIFHTPETKEFGYFSLLSPQPLMFEVELP